MTEKRFRLGYVCGDFGLIDNDKWIDLHSMSENSEKNVQICINKMNELAEENEQLKKDCTALICHNQEYRKENEQLKAQLYCDDEEGVCNICKHHYLVKDDETELGYYNSRCQKGHEQCSKEDVKYCEDFEIKGDLE